MNVYGVGADGYARVRVGQRGRPVRTVRAPSDGNLTPAEFLDLNATVGSWKRPQRHGPGGLPVHRRRSAPIRPSSTRGAARNMQLSRRTAARPPHRGPPGTWTRDHARLHVGARLRRRDRHPDHRLAALPRGPARHAQLAPVVRRPPAHAGPDGRRGNQVIWFTDARPARRLRPDAAGARGDGRVDGEHARDAGPRRRAQQARPARSTRASRPPGAEIAPARTCGTASSTDAAPGACTQLFPLYGTSRIVAGGPIEGGVFNCAVKPVETGGRGRGCTRRGCRARPTWRG